jgi:hypothetical protein
VNAADASMYVAKCTQTGKSRATAIADEDAFAERDRL